MYCKWTYAGNVSVIVKTECRHIYCGGVEHTYTYCPWCGKKIQLQQNTKQSKSLNIADR